MSRQKKLIAVPMSEKPRVTNKAGSVRYEEVVALDGESEVVFTAQHGVSSKTDDIHPSFREARTSSGRQMDFGERMRMETGG